MSWERAEEHEALVAGMEEGIASLRAELAAAREEITDLRLELREAAECLVKDEASLAAARAEAARLRGALPPVVVICVVDRTAHLFGDGDAWRAWSKANKYETAWAVEATTYHAGGGADGLG